MNKNSFLKLSVLILACVQINLFAPRGGSGQCIGYDMGPGGQCEGRSACCLGTNDCSRDSSWFCSVSCNNSDGSTSTEAIGSTGSNGLSNSSSQLNSAPDYALSDQQLQQRIESECYVAPNGQICTKAQLIQASKNLSSIMVGFAKGQQDVAISSLTLDIASRLFGIDTAPLGCAVAERAPAERCKTVARIKQLAAEMRQSEVNIQQLEADIKKLEAESARIQKEMDARIQKNQQQKKAIRQRLIKGGLWNE